MRGKQILLSCILCICMSIVQAQEVKSVKMTELEKMIDTSKVPLIINFWATYCAPCIAEMPAFEKLAAKYKDRGLKLIFVSLDMREDYPAKVSSFITKRKISNEVVWLNETDADYFCPKIDEKWSGAIPATLLLNSAKGHRLFFEKELSEAELEKEIMTILN